MFNQKLIQRIEQLEEAEAARCRAADEQRLKEYVTSIDPTLRLVRVPRRIYDDIEDYPQWEIYANVTLRSFPIFTGTEQELRTFLSGLQTCKQLSNKPVVPKGKKAGTTK